MTQVQAAQKRSIDSNCASDHTWSFRLAGFNDEESIDYPQGNVDQSAQPDIPHSVSRSTQEALSAKHVLDTALLELLVQACRSQLQTVDQAQRRAVWPEAREFALNLAAIYDSILKDIGTFISQAPGRRGLQDSADCLETQPLADVSKPLPAMSKAARFDQEMAKLRNEPQGLPDNWQSAEQATSAGQILPTVESYGRSQPNLLCVMKALEHQSLETTLAELSSCQGIHFDKAYVRGQLASLAKLKDIFVIAKQYGSAEMSKHLANAATIVSQSVENASRLFAQLHAYNSPRDMVAVQA